MNRTNRDDFSAKVKDDLSKRVGYRCSKCRKMTSGPNQEGGAVNIGVAAHIYAAALAVMNLRSGCSSRTGTISG